jgi:hypothetical protein
MTDQFDEKDLDQLAEMHGTCLSIYIPTHEYGMEVNESMDMISFKNEIQRLQRKLEGDGFKNAGILLKPAFDLLDDVVFWKNQSSGLAVFIKEGYFKYFRLPMAFETLSVISADFIITPLIPALSLTEEFFILSLNKYDFKLFRCTMADMHEVRIEEELRRRAEEVLIPINYRNDFHEPFTENRDSQVLQRAKEKGDANVHEFFRSIDEIVLTKLKEENGPLLILAGIGEWQGLYRKVSRYNNIWKKGCEQNAQSIPERELHERVLAITQSYFAEPLRNALFKYRELAGSGLTSTSLKSILFDANAGRVESLFIPKNIHIWGRYNVGENELIIEEEFSQGNYCLLNYAARITMNNEGKVFVLERNKIPENSEIAVLYRY